MSSKEVIEDLTQYVAEILETHITDKYILKLCEINELKGELIKLKNELFKQINTGCPPEVIKGTIECEVNKYIEFLNKLKGKCMSEIQRFEK